MREETAHTVQECVVIVIARVHGSRAFPRFPDLVLGGGDVRQFGQDLLLLTAGIRQVPQHAVCIGVRVQAPDEPFEIVGHGYSLLFSLRKMGRFARNAFRNCSCMRR